MPAQIKYLSDFLRRLPIEGKQKFTWLIGAGVSISSGLPSAKDISKRIILFEYLVNNNIRPWNSESKNRLNYKTDLSDFLIWYETQEESNEKDSLKQLLNQAIEWIKKDKESLKDITYDSPESYQLLFKHIFQSSELHHDFLTSIISRAKGINLAHLCLAGILKDHGKEWGQTVFTTNFDDLLLRSLLTINHTARVFGDIGVGALEKPEQPLLTTDYPQIVHLHGRHTGYRLLNTQDQISKFDPHFQESFKNHLNNSNLIVLGYSGWDDMAMKTLEEWTKSPHLIKGNLYWVPYENQSTILEKTRDFLDRCPPNRAFIIEEIDPKKQLNADSFMLALCDILNENGGFTSYREDVIVLAKKQHSFLMEQLKEHPDFNPEEALTHLKKAKNDLRTFKYNDAKESLNSAIELVKSNDLPATLLGEAYLEIGIIYLALGIPTLAQGYLEKAKIIWNDKKEDDDEKGTGMLKKADSLRALAECHILNNNLYKAFSLTIASIHRYNKVKECTEKLVGLACCSILRSIIALRKGELKQASDYLKQAKKHLNSIEDKNIQLLYRNCLACFPSKLILKNGLEL